MLLIKVNSEEQNLRSPRYQHDVFSARGNLFITIITENSNKIKKMMILFFYYYHS
nr:MAG TPA: hypothetical protein [Caudoviricetes sp.]